MGGLFGGGKSASPPVYNPPPTPQYIYSPPETVYLPSPVTPPPAPVYKDPTEDETIKRMESLSAKRKGRAETLLTGGEGLLDEAPTKKPVLGGGV